SRARVRQRFRAPRNRRARRRRRRRPESPHPDPPPQGGREITGEGVERPSPARGEGVLRGIDRANIGYSARAKRRPHPALPQRGRVIKPQAGEELKVVILAGGLGTRLSEETEVKPKPMVEIGGHPILWHIMKHYAQSGL